MSTCKNCNTVTSRNKVYCSNACKQKAYRRRRNVTPTPQPPIIPKNAASTFEYSIVVELIERLHYSHLKPSYIEYEFVRHYHPDIQKITPFVEQLILIKRELNTGYLESPYIIAFKRFLESKLYKH